MIPCLQLHSGILPQNSRKLVRRKCATQPAEAQSSKDVKAKDVKAESEIPDDPSKPWLRYGKQAWEEGQSKRGKKSDKKVVKMEESLIKVGYGTDDWGRYQVQLPSVVPSINDQISEAARVTKVRLLDIIQEEFPQFVFKYSNVEAKLQKEGTDQKQIKQAVKSNSVRQTIADVVKGFNQFGLNHVNEQHIDGRYRTLAYDVAGLKADRIVKLQQLTFGKVKLPGTDQKVHIDAPIIDYGTTLAYPLPYTIAPHQERVKTEITDPQARIRIHQQKLFSQKVKDICGNSHIAHAKKRHEYEKAKESEGQRLRRLRKEKRERAKKAAEEGVELPEDEGEKPEQKIDNADSNAFGLQGSVKFQNAPLGSPEARDARRKAKFKAKQEEAKKKLAQQQEQKFDMKDIPKYYRTSTESVPRMYAISTGFYVDEYELKGIAQGVGQYYVTDTDFGRLFISFSQVRVIPEKFQDMDKWRLVFKEYEQHMESNGTIVIHFDKPITNVYRDVVYMDDEIQVLQLTQGGIAVVKRMFVFE